MNEGILTSIFEDIKQTNNIPAEEVQTCLESIESDLNELESIDEFLESYEKASFESTMENVNLLNSVLAYKNIKSGNEKSRKKQLIIKRYSRSNN